MIEAALAESKESTSVITGGTSMFVGYLMLDPWIGNQDRHDENWGFVISPPEDKNNLATWKWRLAPSYDHASSLGRELQDEMRKTKLCGRDSSYDMAAYARKSRSAFCQGEQKLSTFDAFHLFAIREKKSALFWLECLLDSDMNQVIKIVENIPLSHMSVPCKEFALAFLKYNMVELARVRGSLDA